MEKLVRYKILGVTLLFQNYSNYSSVASPLNVMEIVYGFFSFWGGGGPEKFNNVTKYKD